MAQQSNPQIDVTITPALRALLARQTIGVARSVPPRVTPRPAVVTEPSAMPRIRPRLQSHSLRRDGMRPLRIDAALIAAETVEVPVDGVVLQQQVAIYADASDSVYMALAMLVPPDAAARSLFAAGRISAQEPTRLLCEWCANAAAVISRLAPPLSRPDPRVHICTAFRSLSSLCADPERSLNERIRT